MTAAPAELAKPRDCKFCVKPYLKPCDGEDPTCANRQYAASQVQKSDEKKA